VAKRKPEPASEQDESIAPDDQPEGEPGDEEQAPEEVAEDEEEAPEDAAEDEEEAPEEAAEGEEQAPDEAAADDQPPPEFVEYEVRRGETLSKIAARVGMRWRELYELNRELIGDDPNHLQAGMTILLPADAAGEEDAAPAPQAAEPEAPRPEGSLAPEELVEGSGPLAHCYNRIGGLLIELAEEYQVEVPASLAVWMVESGGHVHEPGKAIIRFENHHFHRHWGAENEEEFLQYYRFDPHQQWKGHCFRTDPDDEMVALHGDQEREYAALEHARSLAGDDKALCCISIGGPQIMIEHHKICGFETPLEMYDAFQESEEAHVRAFFEFCKHQNLLFALSYRRWLEFAKGYNGTGQAQDYAARLEKSYLDACRMLGIKPTRSV
jgi:hypothetical protein